MVVKYFSDHLNNTIPICFPPKRIISLVPSQTELLADLGLSNQVVGITKFCVHPHEWITKKKIVGGTKKFHFDIIDRLNPDLIIANKEENYQEGIEQLKQRYPVWISDVVTWGDSLKLINDVGEITDRKPEAEKIVELIERSFSSIGPLPASPSVLYLIWKNPWMAAASGTFIHTLLNKLGLKNCLENATRYPELAKEEIHALSPDIIFLSSEPFPFKESHINEVEAISPTSHVIRVDGEMFSWYGSRQVSAVNYFKKLLCELADHCKSE